jgi:hypothetical protein
MPYSEWFLEVSHEDLNLACPSLSFVADGIWDRSEVSYNLLKLLSSAHLEEYSTFAI